MGSDWNNVSLEELRKILRQNRNKDVKWKWRYTASKMGSSQSVRNCAEMPELRHCTIRRGSLGDLHNPPEEASPSESSKDLWAYTPWHNGYHQFKEDITSKCSRFVQSYVMGSPPNNNDSRK